VTSRNTVKTKATFLVSIVVVVMLFAVAADAQNRNLSKANCSIDFSQRECFRWTAILR
jgi:hypothetical protein